METFLHACMVWKHDTHMAHFDIKSQYHKNE